MPDNQSSSWLAGLSPARSVVIVFGVSRTQSRTPKRARALGCQRSEQPCDLFGAHEPHRRDCANSSDRFRSEAAARGGQKMAMSREMTIRRRNRPMWAHHAMKRTDQCSRGLWQRCKADSPQGRGIWTPKCLWDSRGNPLHRRRDHRHRWCRNTHQAGSCRGPQSRSMHTERASETGAEPAARQQ